MAKSSPSRDRYNNFYLFLLQQTLSLRNIDPSGLSEWQIPKQPPRDSGIPLLPHPRGPPPSQSRLFAYTRTEGSEPDMADLHTLVLLVVRTTNGLQRCLPRDGSAPPGDVMETWLDPAPAPFRQLRDVAASPEPSRPSPAWRGAVRRGRPRERAMGHGRGRGAAVAPGPLPSGPAFRSRTFGEGPPPDPISDGVERNLEADTRELPNSTPPGVDYRPLSS